MLLVQKLIPVGSNPHCLQIIFKELFSVEIVAVVHKHFGLRIEPVDKISTPRIRSKDRIAKIALRNELGCLYRKCLASKCASIHFCEPSLPCCPHNNTPMIAAASGQKCPLECNSMRPMRDVNDSQRKKNVCSDDESSGLACASEIVPVNNGATIIVRRTDETGRLREAYKPLYAANRRTNT